MVLWVSVVGTGNSCGDEETGRPGQAKSSRHLKQPRKQGKREHRHTPDRCASPTSYLQAPLLPHERGESADPSERHGAELDVEVVVEMSLERL